MTVICTLQRPAGKRAAQGLYISSISRSACVSVLLRPIDPPLDELTQDQWDRSELKTYLFSLRRDKTMGHSILLRQPGIRKEIENIAVV